MKFTQAAGDLPAMLKLATKFAPLRPGFEVAHRAGFRCAELWLDGTFLSRWEEIARLARDYPFEYVLHFPNGLDLPPQAPVQCVNLANALDCRCLVIHQPLADRFGDALRRLDPSLPLAVENHHLDPPAFLQWAEENSTLTLDVEHLWLLTLRDVPLARLLDEVKAFLHRFGSKVRHVHLPGYWPGLATHRPMYCSRDMVFPVLSLLDDHDFQGLIVAEANDDYQNPLELRMDVLLFDAWRRRRNDLDARDAPPVVLSNS
jgi:sugar phosphate isomerase/epimerase